MKDLKSQPAPEEQSRSRIPNFSKKTRKGTRFSCGEEPETAGNEMANHGLGAKLFTISLDR
jgi:hypothetical protein